MRQKKSRALEGPEFQSLNEFYKERLEKSRAKPPRQKDWFCKIYRFQWQKDFKTLTPFERCIWISIKLYAGSNGSAFPSHQTIAEELNVGLNTIKRNLKSLEAKKFITQTKRPGRSNLFFLKKTF
jgi:DNA-binding MarR family transcriptional regulator